MATLVYAPGARVHIETIGNGIIDVSDDLIMGALNRVTGPEVSQFQFALKNPGRKYDGVFTPMDKIIVQMKRVRWLQEFSGYLDTVPYFTVYAQRVDLVASCTMKRLQFFYWDPDTQAAWTLLHPQGAGTGSTATTSTDGTGANSTDQANGTSTTPKTPSAVASSAQSLKENALSQISAEGDGGMKQRALDLLVKVVGWDDTKIHIGRIPATWFKWAGDIAKSVVDAATIENLQGQVGSSATLGAEGTSFVNTNSTSFGGGTVQTGGSTQGGQPLGEPPNQTKTGTSGAQYYWPVPGHETISQPFGAMNGHDGPGGHPGADISAPDGTPMVAVADYKCLMSGPASGFGDWIVLQHPGFAAVYGHMPGDSIRVKPGDTGKGGQQIAVVGHGGNSTGAHLHIEYRVPTYPGTKGDMIAFLKSHGAIDNGQIVAGGPSGTDSGASATMSPEQIDPVEPLYNLNDWLGSPPTGLGDLLSGPRALMNDQPVMPTVQDLMGAAQRQFCSAPNGDFIAWFPDFFGIFKTASIMTIQDIELQDFQVTWSDQHFKTHEFVLGSALGLNTSNTASAGGQDATTDTGQFIGAGSNVSMFTTQGIASIDFPSIMETLFGLKNFDGQAFAKRYGARPEVLTVPTINHGPAEFFFALYNFMQSWTRQWIAKIPVTFMPELFPGMLVQIPKYNFQAYVEAVQHTFSFEEGGGGFQTQITVSSFTKMDQKRTFTPVVGLNKDPSTSTGTLKKNASG